MPLVNLVLYTCTMLTSFPSDCEVIRVRAESPVDCFAKAQIHNEQSAAFKKFPEGSRSVTRGVAFASCENEGHENKNPYDEIAGQMADEQRKKSI